jgi:sugar O-acyltransferase (sialic acid O-acetyltransferase NeuD family)
LRVAIVGAGGHGKVVADALLAAAAHELVGFLDDDARRRAEPIWEYRVLGNTASWSQLGVEGVLLGVGDNAARQALYDRLCESGANIEGVIHPRATLGRSVSVGRGVAVMAGCVINADTTIGDSVILNTASTVDHDCHVGSHVHLAPGVHLAGGVRVGEGALLGLGAVVLPGVSIGAWAVIGAGAVVLSDVPDGATVVGVPGVMRR